MPEQASRAWVALGSNLQQPAKQVARAFEELDALPQTRLVARSSLYQSAPWGYASQPDFVNAVARLETGLDEYALLAAMRRLETAHGRPRPGAGETPRFGPRILDLDLLLFDQLRRESEELTLPHPRMAERAFVLMPLAEIDPELVIPDHGSVRQLLDRLDTSDCTRLPAIE